jgi:RNA polymerase sigma factor (sigma-70 family)
MMSIISSLVSGSRSLNDVLARSSATKQSAQSPERELLATISAGNRTAMADLYFLYFTRLGNFFLHVTGDPDLVEELIHMTMFDVWRKSQTIGSDASVSAWIMGLAYSHGQTRLARAELASRHVFPPASRPEHDGALTTASQKPRNLQDLLLSLRFEERAVVHLVYAGGYSLQNIADIMNMPRERVNLLLTQARQRLKYMTEENERQRLR